MRTPRLHPATVAVTDAPMPAPLAVDREQVRMLVMTVGVREAARQCGIAQGTVQDWSAKGKWLADTKPTPAKLPPPASMQRPTNPTSPVDALSGILADDSRETRLSLSRAARSMARQAEDAELEQAGDALQVGKLAAAVHGWDRDEGQRCVLAFFSIQAAGGDETPVIDV